MKTARSIAVVVLAGAAGVAGLADRAEAQWWRLAWTLDISHTRPQRISVEEPLVGPVLYTYLTYEITNRTLREVDIFPLVTLATETFKTYGNVTHPRVKAAAERREGVPLLSSTEMVGPLKVGESRRGIAIFRDVDLKAKEWNFYVAGLSGEYVLQLIPGQAEPLVLYKTYHLTYRNVGDEFEPKDYEIEFVGSEWTYR